MPFVKGHTLNRGKIPKNLSLLHSLPRTKEWNKKIAIAHIGKKYSKEARKKMSLAHAGKPRPWRIGKPTSHSGKNHWNWKGGITPLVLKIRNCIKYDLWRSTCFIRDKFICKKCNMRGTYLEVHHIKAFSLIFKENNIKTFNNALNCEELWDINNGITYCRKCHNETKILGGRPKKCI